MMAIEWPEDWGRDRTGVSPLMGADVALYRA